MNPQYKYVLMTNTLCDGPIIGSWTQEGDGPDLPTVFDTEEEGYKEIADFMVTTLQQFIDGERSLDETDFETQDWIEPVLIDDQGVIRSEQYGILFDPKIGRQ